MIGERTLPRGWKLGQLVDAADIERNAIDPTTLEGSYEYLGLEHIDGATGDASFSSTEEIELRSTKFAFTPQHVLFGKLRPNLRKIARPEKSGICSTDILPILPKVGVLDRGYLFHYLRSPSMVRLAVSRTSGANLPRLSPGILAEFPMVFPVELAEQKRIAAILDKADAIRRKRQQAIQLADEFLRSVFLEMFGDQFYSKNLADGVALGQVCESIVVGHVGSTSDYYAYEGVTFLRTQNVRPMKIDLRDVKLITEDFHKKLRKSTIRVGDVLISRVGVNRGMAAVVPKELDEANCANIIVVRPGKNISGEFLAYLINSPFGQNTLVGMTVGAAQGVINTTTVKNWLIPNLPLAQQQEFSAKLKMVAPRIRISRAAIAGTS